jgi:hypothetical protein
VQGEKEGIASPAMKTAKKTAMINPLHKHGAILFVYFLP